MLVLLDADAFVDVELSVPISIVVWLLVALPDVSFVALVVEFSPASPPPVGTMTITDVPFPVVLVLSVLFSIVTLLS